jgi:putative toxin-antitoxin system antitoxin component (TIGR02293 family)
MARTEDLIDILGGAQVLKSGAGAGADLLRERIGAGLPFRSLESVRARLGLTVPETASVLHMPERTMARRRQARRLAADESDRLYRIARIVAYAMDVLGSEANAVAWLRRPNRGFGGAAPLQHLDTDLGTRQIEEMLGRLAHGVIG